MTVLRLDAARINEDLTLTDNTTTKPPGGTGAEPAGTQPAGTQPALTRPALIWPNLDGVFVDETECVDPGTVRPIHVLSGGGNLDEALGRLPLSGAQRQWLAATGFEASAGDSRLIPGADGGLEAVVFSLGGTLDAGQPCGPSEYLCGKLAASLPAGLYRFEGLFGEDASEVGASKVARTNAALAFGLGAYRFDRYQLAKPSAVSGDNASGDRNTPRLVLDADIRDDVRHTVEAIWFARDLINTPASDLGPAEIADAVCLLAGRHDGASVEVIAGDDLLEHNFPMIHAVGRGSDRVPRLIDLNWQPQDLGSTAMALVLIGKGISFDTGGLDIKPPDAMALMKKDMGGSATALACAAMIMAANLPVRLRLLIPTAENAVSGSAFRPGDILMSRAGKTVEIGNTDAEGRLVLADAITYAEERSPHRIVVFATLTGSARVALGPDLPALFATDDDFAARLLATGEKTADPLWRMPLWQNYDRRLESPIADMNNISDGPFAGAITAALFLKRFVSTTPSFAHIDLYGWRPSEVPLGPKGGEPASARAVFETLRLEIAAHETQGA